MGYMKKQNPNRIHELRLRRRWSQPELAERVGAHWVTISKLERGQMQLTQDWMERLSSALGVLPAELISDAPLTRTVYVTGSLQDRGVADPNLESDDDQTVAFDIELGVEEPDRTEWYFVNTDAYYPIMSNGDLIRFKYPSDFRPSVHIGKLCLIEISQNPSKKIVGVLNTSVSPELFDVHIVGGAPVRGVKIYDLAVASLAVMSPVHKLDDDSAPLP